MHIICILIKGGGKERVKGHWPRRHLCSHMTSLPGIKGLRSRDRDVTSDGRSRQTPMPTTQNKKQKLSLPRVPSNESKDIKGTILIFGVPTVVLVKEDCSLVGYDILCACSADMLEELATSIFKVCTGHILDYHPGYHRRHCSMHPAAWMDIPFWLSSNHRQRPGSKI